jgi:hypothetical protein
VRAEPALWTGLAATLEGNMFDATAIAPTTASRETLKKRGIIVKTFTFRKVLVAVAF